MTPKHPTPTVTVRQALERLVGLYNTPASSDLPDAYEIAIEQAEQALSAQDSLKVKSKEEILRDVYAKNFRERPLENDLIINSAYEAMELFAAQFRDKDSGVITKKEAAEFISRQPFDGFHSPSEFIYGMIIALEWALGINFSDLSSKDSTKEREWVKGVTLRHINNSTTKIDYVSPAGKFILQGNDDNYYTKEEIENFGWYLDKVTPKDSKVTNKTIEERVKALEEWKDISVKTYPTHKDFCSACGRINTNHTGCTNAHCPYGNN